MHSEYGNIIMLIETSLAKKGSKLPPSTLIVLVFVSIILMQISLHEGVDLCYGRWDDHGHRLTDFSYTKSNALTKTVSF